MTIYPKQTAPVVAWKKDWNGTWTNAPDMEVQSIHRSCGSQGDDTATLLLRYGVIVESNETRIVEPITQIVANSYVRIQQDGTTLFIGVVVDGEDQPGATMEYNGSDVLTGNQIFHLVGTSEILRRHAVWQSRWMPGSQAAGDNTEELGTAPFKIDWIPPYNGNCRNYVLDVQPNEAFTPYTSYNSNMALDSANNPTNAGFGGARALTVEQFCIYFSKLLEPQPAQPKLPTFNLVWSSDCNNTKKQKPLELDTPIVDNAYDVFRKLINPSSSGLDFYFDYSTDPINVKIFPAFATGIDNNTNTSTLDLESPLIDGFPTIRNSFRKYTKYRFIGERIVFVDCFAGAYHVTDYSTNFVPLKPLTNDFFSFTIDNVEYYGINKWGIGDPFVFDWEKFQPEVTIKNDGTFQITNNPFPKQTLYLRTLDWVMDKFGRRRPGPVVTIGGAEFERRNRGGQYNYTDIQDDNIAENQTYKCVSLEDVELTARPLDDTIGIAIDGECRRLYGGRDSSQFGRYCDTTSDITDIKETISDVKYVQRDALKYCYPDLCYDTMTVTLAWESDQRTQVVFGDENAVDEQVVYVPDARLVIVRGYMQAGSNTSPNVDKNDNLVGHFQDFEKIVQTMRNIASAAQNQRWGVSCAVKDVLSPDLLGSVIQLQRGGVQTTTDAMVRTMDYSFPADSSALTTVN